MRWPAASAPAAWGPVIHPCARTPTTRYLRRVQEAHDQVRPAIPPDPTALAADLPQPLAFAAGYRHRRRVAVVGLHTLAILLTLLGGFLVQRDLDTLADEAALWNDPAATELTARFDHTVEPRFGLLPYYRGLVHLTIAGRSERRDLAFPALTTIPNAVPFVVRVRPDDPAAFCSSWQRHTHDQRIALTALFALLMLLFAAVPWLLARSFRSQLALLAALERDGRAIRVPVLTEQTVHENGARTRTVVTVELAHAGQRRRVHTWFAVREGGPFRLGEDAVLALWSPQQPLQALVLRHDLWPLHLPPDAVAIVRRRLHEALASSPPGTIGPLP